MQLIYAMSPPDHSVDIERGQVSEKPSRVDISGDGSSASEQEQVEHQGFVGRASSVPDIGSKFSLPNIESPGRSHSTTTREEAAHPTLNFSHGQNAEQEDFVGRREALEEQGPGATRILRNTDYSQDAGYGAGRHIDNERGLGLSQGAIFGDPSRQMWNLSLAQFEKYDREITDRWKSDTDGVLVFTGLFSATVAAFIIESYKGLSVDSGNQTVAVLTQMSQQLVGISNGTVLSTPPPLSNSPPNLPSAIRVNTLWLLSLAISITCALLATLIQQWTRRYMALSYLHDMPHERARVRTFLFTGMEYFRMRQAIEAIPMLLHISVFLFFAGLVDFFLLYNKTVAWVFIGWVGLFVSVYAAMTVIPNIIFSCPYRTPFTGLLWRLSQLLAVIGLILRNAFTFTLDAFLRLIWRPINGGASMGIGSLLGREELAKRIAAHKHWFSEGLQHRVVSNAIEASSLVDRDALIWTLTKLDEDKEVEDYVSRIPGFFQSRIVPEASKMMLGLMDSSPSGGDSVLATRLSCLLGSCLPNSVDPSVDNNRLNICLTAIWYYAKEYNRVDPKGFPMSRYFRTLFADEIKMSTLLASDDFHTKVMVLAIRSLLVARLMEEVGGQTESPQVSEGELLFLKKALGPLWRLDLADHRPMELTNLDTMVSELEQVVGEKFRGSGTLSHKVLDTLNILAKGVFDSISPHPPTKHLALYLSVLDHARRTLKRCLMLSKKCSSDTDHGRLMRSNTLDPLIKILGEINDRLARHTVSRPYPEPHAHAQSVNQGIQSMTNEERTRHSVIPSTIGAAPSPNKEALTSTLAELDEDDEFEAFVARIPTLIDSNNVSDTPINIILDLMAPGGGESAFASRLHKFFMAYLPRESTFDPAVRQRRLHVCLAAIWSYARAYSICDSRMRATPEHFQRLFADPNDMVLLATDEDPYSQVMVLCISSLLAIKIAEDVRHRSGNPPASELAFLQKALSPFSQPGLLLNSLGLTELAILLAMLDGLAKLSLQETPSIETLGREASETLEILAENVLDKLPEYPPPESWGSSASGVGRSLEAPERCLSLLRQLSVSADGLSKSAWVDMLIGRLSNFGAELRVAQHAV